MSDVNFVAYETATGRVLAWGHCAQGDLDHQPLGAGQALLTHDGAIPPAMASVDLTATPPVLVLKKEGA